MTSRPTTLRALVCHAAVDMACRGLASLARCSDRPIRFVIHDDGSLQITDYARLLEAVPGIDFVERRAADNIVEPLLSAYPLCREFRGRNPLALKLLDLPLLADAAEVAICDTDVLAFAPFSGVFEWPDTHTTGVFMRDTQNAYAMRPWHLMGSGIALPMYINTGLMLFRTSHHDLDFLEWFLERQFGVYMRLPGWLEQTAWAALAHRGRPRLFDATRVRVIRDEGCLADQNLLIGHFTSSVRGLWDLARPRSKPDAPTAVLTQPTARLTPARLAAEQARRLATRGRTWVRRRAL